ncbi:MAG: hypothetical protein U9R36_04470, partial [Elusimicrobiota bacterium]|nr:hypothetical protein [Elusimicrobiota bacterium]
MKALLISLIFLIVSQATVGSARGATGGSARGATGGSARGAAESPDPTDLLQKVVNNYAGIENYRADITVEFHIYTPYRNMMIS